MTNQHETEFEYEGDHGGMLVGVAVFQYETEKCFDKDIGGSDGVEVSSIELMHVRVDGMQVTRDQVEALMTVKGLREYESSAINAWDL